MHIYIGKKRYKTYTCDIIFLKKGLIFIEIRYSGIVLLLVLSILSDVKTFKISNKIVLPFVFLGFVLNIILYGFQGFLFSLWGTIAPFALLFIFYALRMLGAGDIKLFSAVGSIMGVKFVLFAMAYSFIAGGILAFFIIIIRNNSKQRFRYIVDYIKTSLLTFTLTPYTDFGDKTDNAKFHFSYAIGLGVFTEILISIGKI